MTNDSHRIAYERLLRRVRVEGACWIFTGPLSKGYAYVVLPRPDHRKVLAHRLAWECKNGPIPDGLELHHTCERRACVNPDHVVPLSSEEHKAIHRSSTCRACGACNWYHPPGRARQCRSCSTRLAARRRVHEMV